jgi:hypothetical protein
MRVVVNDISVVDIDEALGHLRLKLQDRYGNRLTHKQREFYLESVNDLLDARLELTGGNRGSKVCTANAITT